VVLVLLIALAAMVALLIAKPGRAADTSPLPTVVVQPGDTLWSIAGDHAPARDRFGTIEDIRRLNHLDGYRIRAGQRLVLPRQ
jgi:LysM repeat protein